MGVSRRGGDCGCPSGAQDHVTWLGSGGGGGVRRFRIQRSPEFQTLLVWSAEPDTIFFPSGEKPTEKMLELWALLFSVTSSSVAARGSASKFQKGVSGFGLNAHPNPRL